MLKNEKGFTVIELMLALTLLLVALGLGYQLLFYAQDNFERSEKQWQRQNEVMVISSYISNVIDKSIYVNITSDENDIVSGDGAIYKEIDGEDIYLQNGLIETAVIGNDLDISYAKVLDINGSYYPDLLELTISAEDINYELISKIKIENMLEDRRIVGDINGNILVFRTEETVAAVPLSIDNCYIATAANGSKMEPSVRLLRRFRDQVLLKTNIGTKFVDFYYKNSPPLANIIASNEVYKFVTRIILLPLVGLATLMLTPVILLYVITGMLMALIIYKKKNKYILTH